MTELRRTANVLFITADQWRGDCLSALGHPTLKTPTLDALGADGVLFRRHFANAAPCGPSRASLHTGLYLANHRSGTNGTPLDARHVNWAQVLRAQGHDPVLFGYTDTSVDPRTVPADSPALNTYEGPLPGLRTEVLLTEDVTPWANWLTARGYDIPEPNYRLYTRKADQPEFEQGGATPAPLAIPAEHHDTRFMVDQLIEWLDHDADAGWHVHLSLMRPHPPWIAPPPYHALYPPGDINGWRRAASVDDEALQHPYLAWQLQQPHYAAPDNIARQQRLQASYWGLMREVDDNLGRLFEHLKARGLWDDTLIVFTSDHGEQMGDHWLLGKCGYFDQSFHIPLIVRDPRPAADTTRGQQLDVFTENVDVMPTLLNWCGAAVPAACDGRSLLPWLHGQRPPNWRRAAFWEYDFREVEDDSAEQVLNLPQHACNLAVLRGEQYKYVHFAGLPALLFDLQADPDELQDLASDTRHATTLLDCAQSMLSLRMRHADQALTHMKLTNDGLKARPASRW